MKTLKVVALIVEALLCFGIPFFFLVLAIPMGLLGALIATLSLSLDGATALPLVLIVAAAAGSFGVAQLLTKILVPESKVVVAPLLIGFLLCGITALGVSAFLFSSDTFWWWVTMFVLPMLATGHFVFMGRFYLFRSSIAAAQRCDRSTSEKRALHRAVYIVCSLLLFAAVALLVTHKPDRSCHNLLQFGPSFVPKAVYRLNVPDSDWQQVAEEFATFGVQYGVSFKGSSTHTPGTLHLSLCSSSGVNMEIAEHRGETQKTGCTSNCGISIFVYEVKPGSDWNRLGRELELALNERWPGQLHKSRH